jgi:enoyl-CoA hydratase
MCDIILASPSAVFGQPEISLGIIPGGGGTQRLTHAIGKSRSMELILTGRTFSALDAEKWGLVSRVVSEGDGEVVKESLAMARQIAEKGRLAVLAAKETVNAGVSPYDVSIHCMNSSHVDCTFQHTSLI